MTIIDIGIILVAIGIILIAIGYNLKLPGYSRKKMLAGISMAHQMVDRRRYGDYFMKAGVSTMILTIIFVFLIFGMFLTINVTETNPKKVDIMTAQGRTVVIADGKVYEFTGAHYHIKRVYFKRKFNAYGFKRLGASSNKLRIISKDQWER